MQKVAVFEEPTRIDTALWHELYAGLEYLKLKVSPVYYGAGAPRGDGAAVVVVPGFFGCDAYLVELYLWLWRIGYKPYFSRIGHNAECPDILTRRLLNTVYRANRHTGRQVHLLGHSLGGVLARGVASIAPDRVASVITLGSPFRGVRVNENVLDLVMAVRRRVYHRVRRGEDCYTSACVCGFTCAMREDFPTNVPQTAIYTKEDGVVDWRVSRTGNPKVDIEAPGTHIGLVWNPMVYRAVAKRLAEVSAGAPDRAQAGKAKRGTARKRGAGTSRRKRSNVRAPGPAQRNGRGLAAGRSAATRTQS